MGESAQSRTWARRRELVRQLKAGPCIDCGNSYPHYVMEFDHARGEKIGTIAALASKVSLARLVAEIEKCDLLCANCHRIRTYVRRIAE